MSENFYYNNDVCVVGIGCVLPEADDPRKFWDNLLAGRCSIRKMSEERFKSELYLSGDKNAEDKSYSNQAAFVENPSLFKKHKENRLQAMALEATRQSLDCLNSDMSDSTKKHTSVFLGCMGIDEAFILQKFYKHNSTSIKKYIEKNRLKNGGKIFTEIKKYFNGRESDTEEMVSSMLTSSVINLIKRKFSLKGEGALVDARVCVVHSRHRRVGKRVKKP